MPRHDFRKKVVVITGASSGIGREIAYQLCPEGALLALASRDQARLEAVADECGRRGASAIGIPTDVSVEAECKALIDRTIEHFGRIDTLIINAGIGMRSRFDELGSVEPIERIMRINFLGAVYCTYYALPHLKQSRGRIVVVASLAAKAGVPMLTGYAASKHAMAGFFDSLRPEIAPAGITITMVHPGFVATDIASRAIGPWGTTVGIRAVARPKIMPVDKCARTIIRAARHRRREVVMTPRGKFGQWLKLVAPGAIDRIAARAIEHGW